MLLNRKKVNRKEKNRNKKKSGRESGSQGEKEWSAGYGTWLSDTSHRSGVWKACSGNMENSTKGSIPAFLRSLPTHHKTTVISRFLFWKMPQGTWRSDSYSGRQMTGKFRKVASHYAPDPAFGLFLNLPWGICPLEPRHVNSVSNPAKCPPDIPSEDLLID